MWSFQTQMLTTFYSLSGVLVCLAGLYGVAKRMEPVVRIYLFFLATSRQSLSLWTARRLRNASCSPSLAARTQRR